MNANKKAFPTEKNTYGLPQGEPIRRELRACFREQRDQILGLLGVGTKDLGPDIPVEFPPFELGDLAMSGRMVPLLTAYWDQSGTRTYARLGLDPDRWDVTNPHLRQMIDHAALAFSRSTNETTSRLLNDALDALRGELIAGLVTRGESVQLLTQRVLTIFDDAETWRARRIASTEASRAVHAAQVESAKQSGVVSGHKWLLSADACPMCQTVARRVDAVPLGVAFAVIGDNPDYKDIYHPPLHPSCQCAMEDVLKEHISGEPTPDWGQTLVDPVPGPEDYPEDERQKSSNSILNGEIAHIHVDLKSRT